MRFNVESIHGTVLNSTEVAGLTLSETAYAPQLRLARHSHQSPYFCFVLAGGFTEVYGRRSRVCDRSILIYHPAGESHADSFHAASRCFNLEINPQLLRRIEPRKAVLDEPADFRGGSILSQLVVKLYREFRQPDNLSSLVIEGVMLEILAKTSRQLVGSTKNAPLWLLQTFEILQDRFRENLSLAEIAGLVGVHETHLAREFRRRFGYTAGEYVRHLRIEFACRQLTASRNSLAEIAHAIGFFDQSHFTRTFKQFTGMTPSEYRTTFRSH